MGRRMARSKPANPKIRQRVRLLSGAGEFIMPESNCPAMASASTYPRKSPLDRCRATMCADPLPEFPMLHQTPVYEERDHAEKDRGKRDGLCVAPSTR